MCTLYKICTLLNKIRKSYFLQTTLKLRVLEKGFIGYANEAINSQNWFPIRWKLCTYVHYHIAFVLSVERNNLKLNSISRSYINFCIYFALYWSIFLRNNLYLFLQIYSLPYFLLSIYPIILNSNANETL